MHKRQETVEKGSSQPGPGRVNKKCKRFESGPNNSIGPAIGPDYTRTPANPPERKPATAMRQTTVMISINRAGTSEPNGSGVDPNGDRNRAGKRLADHGQSSIRAWRTAVMRPLPWVGIDSGVEGDGVGTEGNGNGKHGRPEFGLEGSELRRRRRRSAANQHRGGYRLVEPATTIITVVAATVIGSPVPSIGPERWRPENFTTTLATLTPSWDDCHVGVQNGGGGRPSRRDQWQHTDGDPGPTNYITPRFLVNELEGCGWSELVAGTSTSGIVQWKVYTVEIKYTIKYKWNKNLSYKGIGWKSIIFRTYHLSQ